MAPGLAAALHRLPPRLLACLPPETAHDLAIRLIPLAPRIPQAPHPRLRTSIAGLALAHPLGLAAGFDKDARAAAGLLGLGFAFVEVGTVTIRPQAGNPKPRLFRLAADRAIINRMGFNNAGIEAMAGRLQARPRAGITGVNIGINKDSTDPARDYGIAAARLLPLADYLTVNVSSPNTPGLRDLQEERALAAVLDAVLEARKRAGQGKPVLLKVAPDLDDRSADAITETAIARGIDGIIATNTTIARPPDLRSPARSETGGLSGRPLLAPATRLLQRMARRAAGRLAFIGVGGIASGADAYAKILNGACALQLYTAFVYEGPAIIERILGELDACLARDGHKDLAAAVGAGL
ncbi:MAG: quinone-dependent dihydroorotate dehydrogenase [Geminicoccaceae bacterium]